MEVIRAQNVDTRIVFPIQKSDTTFITGATGLDSEFALLGAHGAAAPSFSDCGHEATEIASTGLYYLDVAAAEVNDAQGSIIQIKSSSTGAIVQVILINTGMAGTLDIWEYATRTLTALDEDSTTIDLNSTTIGTVSAVTAISAGGIAAASFAAGAIDAAAIAADAGTEIGTACWATAARTLTALDEDSTTIDLNGTTIGAVSSIATGGITAASFAAGAVDAAALATDAVTEIAHGIFDHDISAHKTTTNTLGLWLHRIRQYLTNKTDEAADSTSVDFFSEADDTTSIGTQTWDESSGIRGRWTGTW